MSASSDPGEVREPDSTPGGLIGRLWRLWRLPLWAHLAALAAVLLVLVPVIGTDASFSADEGAAIVQARSLARGDGWIVDHPLAGVDPSGVSYPLELSARGPKGVAPFAKHPLYAVLLAGADRAGGVTAMVMLSLLGTLAAAAVAAGLVGRMDRGLTRAAVWAVGLGSPLLFDGFVVIAHTLGAALAGGAVLVAVVAIERRRAVVALGVAPLMFVAVLLRTEAVLFGMALAAAALALGLAQAMTNRNQNRAVREASLEFAPPIQVYKRGFVGFGVVAIAATSGAGAGVLVERAWARAIVGATPASTGGGPTNDLGFVAGRIKSFTLTWLRPGYDGGAVETFLVLMAVAVVAGVVLARRRPGDAGAVRLLSGVAVLATVGALVVAPTNLVPGLLVTSPVLAGGLVAMRRDTLRRETLQSVASHFSLGVFALFAVAVIATQYTTGGSGEWGGRYFSMGLPILVPVALLALHDLGRRLPDIGTRRWCGGALVACSMLMATMGVNSIRSTHRFTSNLMSGIDRAAVTSVVTGDAGGAGLGGEPIILTTEPAIPRLAWATFDRQRWLLVEPSELEAAADRLAAAGVKRFAVVTAGPDRAKLLPSNRAETISVDSTLDRVGWRVAVVMPRE